MLAIKVSFQPLSSLIEFTPAPIATGLTVTVPEGGTYGGPDTFGFIGTNRSKRSLKETFSRYSRQNWTVTRAEMMSLRAMSQAGNEGVDRSP